MVFSSIYFLLYFLPVFFLFYIASPDRWKNAIALLASIYFYCWGAPKFFFVVFGSLIIDFYLVRLAALSRGSLRSTILALNIALDVGILLVAKYLNFFVHNLNKITAVIGVDGIEMAAIVLPIGISFITFQKISYVVDCYQRVTPPLERFWDYVLYILLFPQLIAGPIVRYKEIAAQLVDRKANEGIDQKLNGLLRFVLGLSKKVLIANSLGIVVDEVFALSAEQLSTGIAWLGIIAYSFQIYFDFSGYSDMAIGLALMMGFRFPENFNFPYIAQSITEFWRRWHITLSNWMKDYLYIPLGGNRVSKRRMYINLWTVFLISGLWHGAAWTFILWGAFHGLFLIFDRLFLVSWMSRIGQVGRVLLTYVIVLVGWVLFRAADIGQALMYLTAMFGWKEAPNMIYLDLRFWVFFALAALLSFAPLWERLANGALKWYKVDGNSALLLSIKVVLTLFLGIWCVADIFSSSFNPFIYFRF
ncbi:MAG: MBOAT family O-acyltransferase [Bacteroidota bacterium]